MEDSRTGLYLLHLDPVKASHVLISHRILQSRVMLFHARTYKMLPYLFHIILVSVGFR